MANECRPEEGCWRLCGKSRKGLLVVSLQDEHEFELSNYSGQIIHSDVNVGVSPRPVAERRMTETQ